MILQFLSRPQDSAKSARDISEKYKIPYDTTAKILQSFSNAGFSEGKRGVKGGHTLVKPLEEISLLEMAKSIGEDHVLVDCIDKGCGLLESCDIHGPLLKLHNILEHFFHNLKLADLLENKTLAQNHQAALSWT